VHFAGGFTTMAVMNPTESKLTKHTSVHSALLNVLSLHMQACAYDLEIEYLMSVSLLMSV
jgi:hypothetical protein